MNEGVILKNFLKGTGKEIGDIAVFLKMSRQNLNHHLRKEILETSFRLLVEKKLGLKVINGLVVVSENTGFFDSLPDTPIDPLKEIEDLNRRLDKLEKNREEDKADILLLKKMILNAK